MLIIKYTTQFIMYNCLFDYCMKKLLNDSLANETKTNKQCSFNRTGMLCGKCARTRIQYGTY